MFNIEKEMVLPYYHLIELNWESKYSLNMAESHRTGINFPFLMGKRI